MALSVGQPAPDFSLRDQHGVLVSLSDLRGSKKAIVVFYPFAFSGVCSAELAEVRDNLGDLQSEASAVLAVSCDPMYALRTFADRDGLTFPLLSDFWPHGAVSRAYDSFNEQLGCANRSTYVVDRDGILRWQVSNPLPEARDLADYRKALAEIA